LKPVSIFNDEFNDSTPAVVNAKEEEITNEIMNGLVGEIMHSLFPARKVDQEIFTNFSESKSKIFRPIFIWKLN
jgi:hypothetical protein